MSLFKKIFDNDDAIVGLSGFKKEDARSFHTLQSKFSGPRLAYSTNYNLNMFVGGAIKPSNRELDLLYPSGSQVRLGSPYQS